MKPTLFKHVCPYCREEYRRAKDDTDCPNCGHAMTLKPKVRKAYRRVWVEDRSVPHGVSSRLCVDIYPHGELIVRESGRRHGYTLTAGALYVLAVRSAVAKKQREKKEARVARKKRR